MRRLAALLCLLALVGSACGKYGPPERGVSRAAASEPAAPDPATAEEEQEESP